MWEIIVSLIVICILATILMHHHHMKQQLCEATDCDARLIRNAAQKSLKAAKIMHNNPLEALRECDQAEQTLEDLMSRRHLNASKVAGVDIQRFLKELFNHKKQIYQLATKRYPELIVSGVPEGVRELTEIASEKSDSE